jgi:micrococcal nuclease
MYILSSVLLTLSLIAVVVGLIKPSIFQKFLNSKATRKNILLFFGIIIIASGILASATEPQSVNDARINKSVGQKPENQQAPDKQSAIQSNLYKVVKVIDGDTVDVDFKGTIERIRLIGIDAPEMNDQRNVVECFAKESHSKLSELINDKQVKLEQDNNLDNRDTYGRLLRYIYLDNKNINKQMIDEGYAFEYTYNKTYKYQTDFKAAEKSAREESRGLWAANTCNGKREKSTTATPSPTQTLPAQVSSNCDPNYAGGCVPNVSYDLDCSDISFVVKIVGTDKHKFDRDGDGIGCESN